MAEASVATKEEMEVLEDAQRRSDRFLLLLYLDHKLMPGMRVGVEKKADAP